MLRKTLSLLLVMCMVLSMVPFTVFADDTVSVIDNENGNDNATPQNNPETKVVTGVAKIGDETYASLAAALAAAQANDTIVLLCDVTVDSKILISKNITVEGNNHKIIANHTNFILETSSDCTFQNVTLDTNNKSKGVKITSGNVVFDNLTIPNSNKSDAITVYGTLTLKTYFKATST